MPGIRRDAAGRAVRSAVAVMILGPPMRNVGTEVSVTLRGIRPLGLALRARASSRSRDSMAVQSVIAAALCLAIRDWRHGLWWRFSSLI
jgi:hypothetical protein